MVFRPSLPVYKATSSSRVWIARQFRDPYVKQRLSSPASYRSRSAFKLLEIDSSYGNFLTKLDVNTIIDLGAAPGGWSQVVAGKLGWSGDEPEAHMPRKPLKGFGYGLSGEKKIEKFGTWSSPIEPHVGRIQRREPEMETYDPLNIDDLNTPDADAGRGTIIAVDLLHMQPIKGVHSLKVDFLSPHTEAMIHALLSTQGNSDGKADIILSDMAANSSGNHIRDTESSLEICSAVYAFARKHLRDSHSIGRKRGGVLLMKHFAHPLLQRFRGENLEPNFHDVKFIKPDSSRSESSEGYWLCQGWKGN